MVLAPLGALLFAPAVLPAQSPLDGTWKVDMNHVDWSKKPDIYLLQGGMYSCTTCTPAYKIKADGTDQPVTGHPYVDTIAITVVSDHVVKEVDKKGGKVVGTSTTTISPDGKTMSFDFTDSSNTNGGPPVTGKGDETRVLRPCRIGCRLRLLADEQVRNHLRQRHHLVVQGQRRAPSP